MINIHEEKLNAEAEIFFAKNPAVKNELTRRGLAGNGELVVRIIKTMGLLDVPAQVIATHPMLKKRAKLAKALDKGSDLYIAIPYHDAWGNLLEGVYRIHAADGEEPKYFGPDAVPPAAYLAPDVNWLGVKDAPDIPLVWTEGEWKSFIANYSGIRAVGIPGVWSWKNRKAGFSFPPNLADWAWEGRECTIVYDSDVFKPAVSGALHALARELTKRGAVVSLKTLRQKDAHKVGLDDLLLSEAGIANYHAVPTEMFIEGAELRNMNEEFIYVSDQDEVFEFATGIRRNERLLLSNVRNRRFQYVSDAGKIEENASVGAKWLEWEEQSRAQGYTFEADKGRFGTDGLVNLFRGWKYEPKRGDVHLWTELMTHLFGVDTAERRYFQQWAAAPLITPGSKLFTSVILWGETNGAGKSIVGEVIGALYGRYFKELKSKQMFGNFNEWARERLFALCNEIPPMDKHEAVGLLKDLITAKTITLNVKYRSEIELVDSINYLFTSNEPNALYLQELDRRFWVHRVEKILPYEKGKAIRAWINSPEGASALMYHLMHMDMRGFDATAPAPWTAAKGAMIEAGKTAVNKFACDLVDGATHSGEGKPDAENDLWTGEELVQIYKSLTGIATNPTAMGRALHDAGAYNRGQIRLFVGPAGVRRYWILANVGHWRGMDGEVVAEAIRQSDRYASSDLDRWVKRLTVNPELTLSAGAAGFEGHDLWTTEDLIEACKACNFDHKPSIKDMEAALGKMRVARTAVMGTELGGVKLWIVSSSEYWLSKAPAEIAAGYKNKTKPNKF